MIEFYLVRRTLNLSRDILFSYLYLNTVDQPRRSRACCRLAPCMLLLMYAMFSAEDGGFFAPAWVRLLYRGACFFAYLMLSRQMDWRLALYDALLTDCICIIGHNIFLTPLTRPILLGAAPLVSSRAVSPYLCLALVQFVMLPLLYAVYRALPLGYIRSVSKAQTILLITIAACTMYLNSMLRLMTDNHIQSVAELSVFSIMLQFALLICLILMAQSQYNLCRHAAIQLQLSRTQATLESAKKDQQADAMIRKISHDLNNHILSLHHLLGAGEYEKAAQYLDQLRHSIPAKKPVVHTGNLILDSLFAEKLAKAEALGAEIMINADLTPFSTVSDFDQCTIFGNILDNAIEACSKVQHKDARYIYLRSRPYAGYTVFTLSNSYEGACTDASGRFLTTKKDVNNHGYGLSNVRAAVEKHGGILHVHANQEKREFQLSIMLPTAPYAKTTASDSP